MQTFQVRHGIHDVSHEFFLYSTRHTGSSNRNSTCQGSGCTQIFQAVRRSLGFEVHRRSYNASNINKKFDTQLADTSGKVGIKVRTPPGRLERVSIRAPIGQHVRHRLQK